MLEASIVAFGWPVTRRWRRGLKTCESDNRFPKSVGLFAAGAVSLLCNVGMDQQQYTVRPPILALPEFESSSSLLRPTAMPDTDMTEVERLMIILEK